MVLEIFSTVETRRLHHHNDQSERTAGRRAVRFRARLCSPIGTSRSTALAGAPLGSATC
jgi:hypothetical protein